MRTHGASKRRTWRKLHLALDIETRYIAETSLTRNSVDDAEVAVQMLTNKFDGCVERVIGDGAYDKGKVYKAARKIGANLITPLARNAKQQRTVIDPAKLPRDNAIARIRKRSLVETTMYRFKTTFSDRLRHRKFENQITEVTIKAKILNDFVKIGFGATQ